jgi:hypothetical protein
MKQGVTVAGINLQVDPEALAPLVERIVTEAMTRLEADRARVGEKLCYSEPEAAALLGLEPHCLRDERRRGRIGASVGPGRRILYTRADLLAYLAARRWQPSAER